VQSRRLVALVALVLVCLAGIVLGSYRLGSGDGYGRAEAKYLAIVADANLRAAESDRLASATLDAMDAVRSRVSDLNGELGRILVTGGSIRDQLRGLAEIHRVLGEFIQGLGGLKKSASSGSGDGNSGVEGEPIEGGNLP